MTEHHRLDEVGAEYELKATDKPMSLKSETSGRGNSEEALRREPIGTLRDPFSHYKDKFVSAHVDPLASENRPGRGIAFEAEVESVPQPKWRI